MKSAHGYQTAHIPPFSGGMKWALQLHSGADEKCLLELFVQMWALSCSRGAVVSPWQWWSCLLPAAFFTVIGQKCLCLHPSAGHKQTSLWYSIWVQSSRQLTTRKIWSTSEYWSASEWSCTRYRETSTAAHCCWKDRLLPPLLSPCFPLSPCTDAVNLAVSWFSMLTEQETHHWMAFCWVSKLNKLTEKSGECQNWHRTGQELCSWTSPCCLQQPLALYTTYPCS